MYEVAMNQRLKCQAVKRRFGSADMERTSAAGMCRNCKRRVFMAAQVDRCTFPPEAGSSQLVTCAHISS